MQGLWTSIHYVIVEPNFVEVLGYLLHQPPKHLDLSLPPGYNHGYPTLI